MLGSDRFVYPGSHAGILLVKRKVFFERIVKGRVSYLKIVEGVIEGIVEGVNEGVRDKLTIACLVLYEIYGLRIVHNANPDAEDDTDKGHGTESQTFITNICKFADFNVLLYLNK